MDKIELINQLETALAFLKKADPTVTTVLIKNAYGDQLTSLVINDVDVKNKHLIGFINLDLSEE